MDVLLSAGVPLNWGFQEEPGIWVVGDTISEIPQPSPLSIVVPEDLLSFECSIWEEDLCYISGMNGNDGLDKKA